MSTLHKMQYKVEVGIDEFTDNIAEKCDECRCKFVCVTACCEKKLCQYHRRFYVDEGYMTECDRCTELEDVMIDNYMAYIRKNGLIYCNIHLTDQLIFCSECHFYYCTKHFDKNANCKYGCLKHHC